MFKGSGDRRPSRGFSASLSSSPWVGRTNFSVSRSERRECSTRLGCLRGTLAAGFHLGFELHPVVSCWWTKLSVSASNAVFGTMGGSRPGDHAHMVDASKTRTARASPGPSVLVASCDSSGLRTTTSVRGRPFLLAPDTGASLHVCLDLHVALLVRSTEILGRHVLTRHQGNTRLTREMSPGRTAVYKRRKARASPGPFSFSSGASKGGACRRPSRSS